MPPFSVATEILILIQEVKCVLERILVNKKNHMSGFECGEKVILTKPIAGFPEGHPFIVVNPKKTPGEVGGHYYKFTIKVNDADETPPPGAEATLIDMPVKYLKAVRRGVKRKWKNNCGG